jgi:hypothetical protein
MAKVKLGDSSKIISVTPKFYIKDDGTDYTSGESYNGLLAGGTAAAPTGYGAGGHWKITESDGNLLYNNRTRGANDLYISGFSRSTDAIGTYVQFTLPGNEPLSIPSPGNYCMMGASGARSNSGIIEGSDFTGWLTSPGFDNSFQMNDETNKAEMRFMFDFWAYFRKGPQTNGDFQTLFYLNHEGSGNSYDKVFRFGTYNNGSDPFLIVWYGDNNAASRTAFNDIAASQSAGEAIYPQGVAADGGLHHVAIVFDRTNFSNFGTANGPDGFYVDGKYHACSDRSGISSWYTSVIEVNTNALIGCEIYGDNPTWNVSKTSGEPRFYKHFTGKLYHASLSPINTAGEWTQDRMQTINSLKFDIPRNPSKVDFSDRYEYKGRNLLQSLSTLKQKVETEKGTFTIGVSSIKVKN